MGDLIHMSTAERMAMSEQLAQSGMLPRHLNGKPAAVFAITLAGAELGIGAMAACRSINVLQGKLAIDAGAQLGLAISGGVRPEWLHSDEEAARLRLSRDGFKPHEQTFTMQEAQRAGLVRQGPWKQYPAAMLRARCITAAIRAFCPDVLAGCYDPEELGGEPAPADVVDTTAEPEPEPVDPAKAPHHESWAQDQPRFCAEVDRLGLGYTALRDFCLAKGWPKPSTLPQDRRDLLLGKLSAEPAFLRAVNEWMEQQTTRQPGEEG